MTGLKNNLNEIEQKFIETNAKYITNKIEDYEYLAQDSLLFQFKSNPPQFLFWGSEKATLKLFDFFKRMNPQEINHGFQENPETNDKNYYFSCSAKKRYDIFLKRHQ